jgi:hypothetical protein
VTVAVPAPQQGPQVVISEKYHTQSRLDREVFNLEDGGLVQLSKTIGCYEAGKMFARGW